jgi:hypothetical protein
MSRLAPRFTKLRTVAVVALTAVTASLGLFVLHQHPVGFVASHANAHPAGSISLERAASDRSQAPTVALEPGSYHTSSLLTDCGAITWTLTTGLKEGASPDQQVIVGYDTTGDPLASVSAVNGYHIDPKTRMAPPHTTPYQAKLIVTQRRQFQLQYLDIGVYNNAQCSIDLTITKQ